MEESIKIQAGLSNLPDVQSHRSTDGENQYVNLSSKVTISSSFLSDVKNVRVKNLKTIGIFTPIRLLYIQ